MTARFRFNEEGFPKLDGCQLFWPVVGPVEVNRRMTNLAAQTIRVQRP